MCHAHTSRTKTKAWRRWRSYGAGTATYADIRRCVPEMGDGEESRTDRWAAGCWSRSPDVLWNSLSLFLFRSRSLSPSVPLRSLARILVRSLTFSLSRSHVHTYAHTLACSLAYSLAHSLAHSLTRSSRRGRQRDPVSVFPTWSPHVAARRRERRARHLRVVGGPRRSSSCTSPLPSLSSVSSSSCCAS